MPKDEQTNSMPPTETEIVHTLEETGLDDSSIVDTVTLTVYLPAWLFREMTRRGDGLTIQVIPMRGVGKKQSFIPSDAVIGGGH